jgi:hypothetical protein
MHTSVIFVRLAHPKVTERSHQTHLLQQAYLFTLYLGNCPLSALQQSVLPVSHCSKPCPPKPHWGKPPNSPSLAGLFIQSSRGCLPLLFSPAQSAPPSLLCVLFSSLFIIQFFVCLFCMVGISLSRGLCRFIPGVAVGVLHAAFLLTYWSASPKQVRSQHLIV